MSSNGFTQAQWSPWVWWCGAMAAVAAGVKEGLLLFPDSANDPDSSHCLFVVTTVVCLVD